MMMNNHFFHLVTHSPWPILVALNLLNLGTAIVGMIVYSDYALMMISIIVLIAISSQWWRDIIREALYEGTRSVKINQTMGLGMLFFIVSEVWFFISFFWSYFYYSLSPDFTIGMAWPAHGIQPMSFMDIPLLNTLTLLTSGFFVTWSHHALVNHDYKQASLALCLSILSGLYFVIIQAYEYMNSTFSFNDSVFGNSFYILTGFHGIHVMIGLIFISISWFRMVSIQFSPSSFHGYEYSIWYWHFVDLVWLFLYTFLYWWGM
uniref:Cytochrome c oxidase subunit 3 n=1 Tax=Singhiella simplex TaxID=1608328 RepID=A0A7G2CTE8_9HEMI|nr:cytochrome c oxidase subunit 3 [Singhiella simplex]